MLNVRAVPRNCKLYPGIFITTEEKHGNPQPGHTKSACSRFHSVGEVCRHFISAYVYKAAQLSGSPHQLTSSRVSQLGILLWLSSRP